MDQTTLRKQLLYNPATGEFFWLTKRNYGKKAGHLSSPGYIQITLNKKTYAHRLAFLWMTGTIPPEIDHINRVKSDNRWNNLRAATRRENSGNTSPHRDNWSGHKNITWVPPRSSWCCKIRCKGVTYQKYMKSLESLITWRDAKRKELFGEFS